MLQWHAPIGAGTALWCVVRPWLVEEVQRVVGLVFLRILFAGEGVSVKAREAECCQISLANRVPMGLTVT